jgi:hypothetical protein
MKRLSFAIALGLLSQGLQASDPGLDLRGVDDSLKHIIEQLESNFTQLGGDLELWSNFDLTDTDLPHTAGHLEQSFDSPSIEGVVIDSKFLNIQITGHETDNIDVSADIDVWMLEKRDLENVKKGKFVGFEEHENELRIICPDLGNESFAELARMEGEIRIGIPKGMNLSVLTRFGEVSVKDHEGSLRIDTQFGDAQVLGHTGSMEITASYSAVNVGQQAGNTKAQLQFCDAILDGVEGNLIAESRYGYLFVDEIDGNVDLRTQGTLELGDIRGDLQLDTQFGDAAIGCVEGDLRLNNKMGNVHIERVDGQKQIHSQYGKVKILEVESEK